MQKLQFFDIDIFTVMERENEQQVLELSIVNEYEMNSKRVQEANLTADEQ